MFDSTDINPINRLKYQYKKFRRVSDAPVIICGSKADLNDKINANIERIFGEYFRISAKND